MSMFAAIPTSINRNRIAVVGTMVCRTFDPKLGRTSNEQVTISSLTIQANKNKLDVQTETRSEITSFPCCLRLTLLTACTFGQRRKLDTGRSLLDTCVSPAQGVLSVDIGDKLTRMDHTKTFYRFFTRRRFAASCGGRRGTIVLCVRTTLFEL